MSFSSTRLQFVFEFGKLNNRLLHSSDGQDVNLAAFLDFFSNCQSFQIFPRASQQLYAVPFCADSSQVTFVVREGNTIMVLGVLSYSSFVLSIHRAVFTDKPEKCVVHVSGSDMIIHDVIALFCQHLEDSVVRLHLQK